MEDFIKLNKSDVEEFLESHTELLINGGLEGALLDIEEQEIFLRKKT